MAKKFKKEILREAKYVTGDGSGGRQITDITGDRITRWSDTLNKMVDSGLLIPAPELHDSDENPNKYPSEGSKSNYGFWSDFTVEETVDENGNQIKALHGILEVPLDKDAELIGNTVRETSIYAMNKFIDGKGNEWDDAIVHIAPVIKAIEPGQKNFQPIEGDTAIAMSHGHRLDIVMSSMPDLVPTNSLDMNNLEKMLAEVAGISLPENTPDEKLRECLMLALKQKYLSEQNNRKGGSVNSPPSDSIVNEVPIVMSTNQTKQIPPVGTTTPPTETPVTTAAVTEPKVDPIVMSQHQGMMTYVTEQTKRSLSQRLENLKRRHVIDDAHFAELVSQVGNISMSFGEGGVPQKTAVEAVIESLEKVKVPMPANSPMVAMSHIDDNGNYVIQPQTIPSGSGVVDSTRANQILDQMFGSTNR